MFKSYLLSAIRSIGRQKLSTFINVFGLSVGLCCSLLIAIYAIDEFSYDHFHDDPHSIYRLKSRFGIQSESVPLGPYPLDEYVLSNIPEIQSNIRLRLEKGDDFWITYKDKSFIEKGFLLADSNFFSFFSFPLLQGHPKEVLREPNSIVVSQSAALTYFGDADPVGQVLYIHGKHPALITGVMKDFPGNSHFNASFIANFEVSKNYLPEYLFENWGSLICHYYMKLEADADPNEVINKMMQQLEAEVPYMVEHLSLFLQPLLNIRLHSENVAWDIANQGSIRVIQSLIVIAIVIILLASVNYINLYIAQSTKRKKEVGIRKVMGATKTHIFRQNMTESFISVFISFLVALGLMDILLPFVNELSGKTLSSFILFAFPNILWLVAFLVFVAFLSGFYPAMVIGNFAPAQIFRSGSMASTSGSFLGRFFNLRLRQVLIVFQFACAITIIIISLSINRQISYMFSLDYGYKPEGLIVITNPEDENQERRFHSLKNKMEQYHDIQWVAAGENIPSNRHGNFTYIQMMDDDHEVQVGNLNVSPDYPKVLGAKVISGRLFDRDYQTDKQSIVINRTAAGNLGYAPEKIVGRSVISHNSSQPLRIIGVIEDVHFYSLHEQSPPLMFNLFDQPSPYSNILIRTEGDKMEHVIDIAAGLWKHENTAYPFNYSIIEQRHKGLYSREEQTRELLNVFMIVAMMISLLGLFALASYILASRIKEIALRKIMGAKQMQILMMILKEFSILVLVSTLFAWPLAWIAVNRWLENFAYRQEISYAYFILAPVIALVAAWITISYHAYTTAKINAADALKYD